MRLEGGAREIRNIGEQHGIRSLLCIRIAGMNWWTYPMFELGMFRVDNYGNIRNAHRNKYQELMKEKEALICMSWN